MFISSFGSQASLILRSLSNFRICVATLLCSTSSLLLLTVSCNSIIILIVKMRSFFELALSYLKRLKLLGYGPIQVAKLLLFVSICFLLVYGLVVVR